VAAADIDWLIDVATPLSKRSVARPETITEARKLWGDAQKRGIPFRVLEIVSEALHYNYEAEWRDDLVEFHRTEYSEMRRLASLIAAGATPTLRELRDSRPPPDIHEVSEEDKHNDQLLRKAHHYAELEKAVRRHGIPENDLNWLRDQLKPHIGWCYNDRKGDDDVQKQLLKIDAEWTKRGHSLNARSDIERMLHEEAHWAERCSRERPSSRRPGMHSGLVLIRRSVSP
jgi:hypothetical protein